MTAEDRKRLEALIAKWRAEANRTDLLIAESVWTMCADELAAAVALPDAPAESWQPIETAPKDGTRILVFSRYADIVVAEWDETSVYGDRRTGKGMGWCYTPSDGEYNSRETCEPTHWRPLPAPPSLPGGPQETP